MNVTTSQLATYDMAKEAILARRGTGADGLATNVAASFTAGLVAATAARSCLPVCCALPACVLPACSLFACRCLPPPLCSRCLSLPLQPGARVAAPCPYALRAGGSAGPRLRPGARVARIRCTAASAVASVRQQGAAT